MTASLVGVKQLHSVGAGAQAGVVSPFQGEDVGAVWSEGVALG